MRNLEDCKAEVFRRSEERIKERKRARKRVLACCIPLCLLLVAGGLYVRPLLEPVDESAKSGGTNVIPDRELGGLPESDTVVGVMIASVEITDKTGPTEVSRKVTDEKSLEELRSFMAMYFDMPGTKESYFADGADGSMGALGETTVKVQIATGAEGDTIVDELKDKYGLEEKQADYTIVFRESTGEEILFRLYENNLYNENNGCMVRLSETQLTVLKTQLEQAKGDTIDK